MEFVATREKNSLTYEGFTFEPGNNGASTLFKDKRTLGESEILNKFIYRNEV